jgi:hypothetical protein
MKRCSSFTCWTDYPFSQLGDEAYKPSPIRHVRVISYDGSRYAFIEVDGITANVKSCYLYSNRSRQYVGSKFVNRRKLERMTAKRS